MDYIILDLGSDVNILTGQTWESMGKSRLDWSPIQLRLANQAKVLPIGRLSQVHVDIEEMHSFAYFEVINIIDDTSPYPALQGIEWAIENQTIINFRRRILSFEYENMRVVSPIDPLEGQTYVKPIYSEGDGDYIDRIYNISALNMIMSILQ